MCTKPFTSTFPSHIISSFQLPVVIRISHFYCVCVISTNRMTLKLEKFYSLSNSITKSKLFSIQLYISFLRLNNDYLFLL